MLGLTRYGVTYSITDQNGKTTKRTYNGVNFKAEDATTKSNQTLAFFVGQFTVKQGDMDSEVLFPGSVNAIVSALGLTPNGYGVTQENAVTTS